MWKRTTLFFFYKNLVYKNIKASKCPKIKNVVVILLVAISISFEGFEKKWRSYKNKKVYVFYPPFTSSNITLLLDAQAHERDPYLCNEVWLRS